MLWERKRPIIIVAQLAKTCRPVGCRRDDCRAIVGNLTHYQHAQSDYHFYAYHLLEPLHLSRLNARDVASIFGVRA